MKKIIYLFVVTSIFLSSCSKNCPITEAQEEWLFVHTAAYITTQYGSTYDWFLPSKDEINLMYQYKDVINKTAIANGGSGFANEYYWSSIEDDNNYAWCQSFYYGAQSFNNKNYLSSVRAVRAF